jgi:hypothetical protein
MWGCTSLHRFIGPCIFILQTAGSHPLVILILNSSFFLNDLQEVVS